MNYQTFINNLIKIKDDCVMKNHKNSKKNSKKSKGLSFLFRYKKGKQPEKNQNVIGV